MTDWTERLTSRVRDGRARRRTLLQAAGVTGALLATGFSVPAFAADNGQGQDQGAGKGPPGAFSVAGTTAGGAAFTGVLKFTQFSAADGANLQGDALSAVQAGQLLASGTLTGDFRDAAGTVIATVKDAPFTSTVASMDPPASCQVLNLVLGPLNLNLLGLVVSIPLPIIINIFAVPGAGNLLGNLICAVANLLNPGGGTLSQLLQALSNLLAAL